MGQIGSFQTPVMDVVRTVFAALWLSTESYPVLPAFQMKHILFLVSFHPFFTSLFLSFLFSCLLFLSSFPFFFFTSCLSLLIFFFSVVWLLPDPMFSFRNDDALNAFHNTWEAKFVS